MKTFSANAIAETFERDRGVVVRALRNIRPDAEVSGKPQWKLATAAKALEQHNRANTSAGRDSANSNPALVAMFAKFDQAYDTMRALPSLAARRKASIALAPLIGETYHALRQHYRAAGTGDELADYRADHMFLLTLRGFEAPCQWNELQTREAMDVTADA
jgi:hypothetical protein